MYIYSRYCQEAKKPSSPSSQEFNITCQCVSAGQPKKRASRVARRNSTLESYHIKQSAYVSTTLLSSHPRSPITARSPQAVPLATFSFIGWSFPSVVVITQSPFCFLLCSYYIVVLISTPIVYFWLVSRFPPTSSGAVISQKLGFSKLQAQAYRREGAWCIGDTRKLQATWQIKQQGTRKFNLYGFEPLLLAIFTPSLKFCSLSYQSRLRFRGN